MGRQIEPSTESVSTPADVRRSFWSCRTRCLANIWHDWFPLVYRGKPVESFFFEKRVDALRCLGYEARPAAGDPFEGFDGHGLLIDIVGRGKGCAGGGDGLLLAQARGSVSGFFEYRGWG